jgi:hypothetical protein
VTNNPGPPLVSGVTKGAVYLLTVRPRPAGCLAWALVKLVDLLHGMQEVSGSSPLSSTQLRSIFSNAEPMSVPLLRGILRGKIRWKLAV